MKVIQQMSVMDQIVPNTVCKMLNNAMIIINLWWSKGKQVQLIGMGVATIISFVFGYLMIVSLNVGLAFQIGRKTGNHQTIGIYYQRALLINFLCCAFVITPLLYVSKRMVIVFQHIDSPLGNVIGDYLFQLVPSIYSFAFYDTTQTFLQAQGYILAPLIIQIFSVFAHLSLISYCGAAWSKNITDVLCCIAIYIYINMMNKPLKSWIQWTIKCVKNLGNHIKFLQLIGLTTYLQSFFFLIFSFEAYKLSSDQLVCHICYINIYQMCFLIFVGLKEGMLIKLGFQFTQSNYQRAKIESIKIIKSMALFAFILSLLLYVYNKQISQFFITTINARQIFRKQFILILFTVCLDAVQIGSCALLKAVNKNYSVLKINAFIYIISCSLAYILAYQYEYQIIGLWLGWATGLILNTLLCVIMLNKQSYKFKRQFHQKIKAQKLP